MLIRSIHASCCSSKLHLTKRRMQQCFQQSFAHIKREQIKSMGLVNSNCSVLQTAQRSLVDCLCCLMSPCYSLFLASCILFLVLIFVCFCHSLICSHKHAGRVKTEGCEVERAGHWFNAIHQHCHLGGDVSSTQPWDFNKLNGKNNNFKRLHPWSSNGEFSQHPSFKHLFPVILKLSRVYKYI